MNAFWHNLYYKIFRSTGKLMLLIWINIAVFLAINILAVFEKLIFHSDAIEFYSNKYLLLSADISQLKYFWTPLTYMFMHAGILHILFNMLVLFWMGRIFEEFLGKKRTIGLYLLGGLAGGALFVICYNVFPAFTQTHEYLSTTLVGASASVMAIAAAAATIAPDYPVFLPLLGEVKLKWIVLFYVVADFLSIAGPNAGGEIAHLGGALFGFVYVKQLQNGNDWIAAISNWFKAKPKLKVASTNRDKTAVNKPRQEDVDKILDKISKTGYDNLTKQEKDILFRASKK